ncbi:hypothetical protein OsJ_30504 [Oryza sativa Japonica Group]|uniref:Uncharacterized protein n=1 Tax=Oryza sativa subsp. japonica TaxID=39947 RepID=A3C1X8_ORYSJ|nr:hypothetical protein OsJ_30504 [Oryza sativa Japonica Group]
MEAVHGVAGGGAQDAAPGVPGVGFAARLLRGDRTDVVDADRAKRGPRKAALAPSPSRRPRLAPSKSSPSSSGSRYDAVLVPLARRATGNDRGLSHLQRIGVGLALSAVAMAYSAQVERRRRRPAAEEEAMSIMWQAPCYLVLGMAEVFTSIGMLEFFYERSPGS